MNYAVFLHPSVVRYLDHLSENERKRCYMSLKKLSNDPYKPRAGCIIRKLSGKKDSCRLRAGSHRFLYVIRENDFFITTRKEPVDIEKYDLEIKQHALSHHLPSLYIDATLWLQ